MTTELEAGPRGTRTIFIGAKMPIEGGIEHRREGDKGIIHKGMDVNLSKSRKMN